MVKYHNTQEKEYYNSRMVLVISTIAILVAASVSSIQPISAQTYQDKSKYPNFKSATSDPNNTCVTSGDDTKCATASTNGNADVKLVENTLGTWWAKAYHEMNPIPITTSGPSSGFTINVNTLGLEAKFTNYLQGNVQILKNGKTAEARYGMYECWQSVSGWHCDNWFYLKKNTDGTFILASGSSVSHERLVPLGNPDFRTGLHTMGSLFECMTTGTGGSVLHTRCDAYDSTKHWESDRLRMQWPIEDAIVAQTDETNAMQTNTSKPTEITIDFAIRAENHTTITERGQTVNIPLVVDAPADTEKNLKIELVPERGTADTVKFKAGLSKQSLALNKSDVAEGKATPLTDTMVKRNAGELMLTIPINLKPGEYTFAVEIEQQVDMAMADALVSGTLVHVQVE